MFAVIMCGGSGTRFWPVSRRRKPKQFLNITGRGPLVVETCDRLSPLSKDDEMVLVLGQGHLKEAANLFANRDIHIIAEPVGRNTAPCIGLGAIYAGYLGCKGPVAFLPADHFIGAPDILLEDLRAAGEIAGRGGIATLGIVPTRPETGYGYIRRDGNQIKAGTRPAYGVSEFVEKPDLEKARGYMASGEYYWNAGIFVATPETVLREIKTCLPELYQGLMRLTEALGTRRFNKELSDVYSGLKGVSFDNGVMEKTDAAVSVIPSECGWSDVGSWEALYELREAGRDRDQNLAEGETLLIDSEQNFISARGGRLVACLGLRNCLVVDTSDTLLVADLNRSQDIRKVVDRLRHMGKGKLL